VSVEALWLVRDRTFYGIVSSARDGSDPGAAFAAFALVQ